MLFSIPVFISWQVRIPKAPQWDSDFASRKLLSSQSACPPTVWLSIGGWGGVVITGKHQRDNLNLGPLSKHLRKLTLTLLQILMCLPVSSGSPVFLGLRRWSQSPKPGRPSTVSAPRKDPGPLAKGVLTISSWASPSLEPQCLHLRNWLLSQNWWENQTT